MQRKVLGRRRFLAEAAAVAAPLVVPGAILGRDGGVAPSERIALGAIGQGHRGQHVLGFFLLEKDLRCVAVCDCFSERRAGAKALVDKHYGNAGCAAIRFHEDLLGRADIDAVLIATGDRWHTPLSVRAARAGKDIYCEKPCCLTIAEGRALVETMGRYGTVWQCGTQRRTVENYRLVVDVVRSGKIGRLKTIIASFGGWGGNGFDAPGPVPEGFDYDRWLGQAPWAPYSAVRVGLWRNHWDTSAGPVIDMGPHMFDFAQWAHDSERTGPVEYEGKAVFPDDGFANVPFDLSAEARYADGVRIVMDCKAKRTRFEGDEGSIELVDDTGAIRAEPASILAGKEVPKYDWSRLKGHIRDFLDCMRSRRPTASCPEIAHRAHTIAHCTNICLRLGRKLHWDPAAERFVGDDEANRMLARTMRPPWGI
jgi:predicted dehydrogenase